MIRTIMFSDTIEMNRWLSNHSNKIIDIKFNMQLVNEKYDFRYLVIYEIQEV